MKNRIVILLFILPLMLGSCSLFRKTQIADAESVSRQSQFVKAYNQNLTDNVYDWSVASTRLKIVTTDQSISLSTTIKSRRDSLVWLRMTKLLEIMRGQLSDQGFEMINRIDRTSTQLTYDDIKTFIDPEEGLGGLQSILAGDVPFDITKADFNVSDETYILTKTDSIEHKAYISTSNLKLVEYQITSIKDSTSAVARFSNYFETDHGLYPKNIDVEIKGFDIEQINLETTKIEFKQFEKVDFEIPAGYKKTK